MDKNKTSHIFKKFDNNSVISRNFAKTSARKQIRDAIIEKYKNNEDIFENYVFSKDHNLILAKCHEKVSLLIADGKAEFFIINTDTYVPTLRFVHRFPNMLEKVVTDPGAASSILSGSNIMAPGLIGTKCNLPNDLCLNQIVAVYVHGKEHAIAVGKMLMSSAEISEKKRGHAIENIHCLGDGLWKSSKESM